MKIKWLGHAAFLITSESGVRIVTDPYDASRKDLRYGAIQETAEVVTVSHEHNDHNNTSAVRGRPVIMRQSGQAHGIAFRAVGSFHDDSAGSQRGKNTIFCFEVDGIKVCHAGDLGQKLTPQQTAGIGAVDVLLLPVGGCYTLDPAAATEVLDALKPRIAIPMHFKNERNDFPIAPVDDFLKGKKDVSRENSSEIEIKAGSLPAGTRIVVLKPAL